MFRIMLKTKDEKTMLAQLEYMKTFINSLPPTMRGQKLTGKNNLGNYTIQIDK